MGLQLDGNNSKIERFVSQAEEIITHSFKGSNSERQSSNINGVATEVNYTVVLGSDGGVSTDSIVKSGTLTKDQVLTLTHLSTTVTLQYSVDNETTVIQTGYSSYSYYGICTATITVNFLKSEDMINLQNDTKITQIQEPF